MLTKNQISQVKEHLEKAQNPLFLFDNDPDGLCSFLLFQRWLGRGKGVAVKSDLVKSYFRKVNELNADYIFILDKPLVSQDFFEEVKKVNLPVVWIDHHEIDLNSVPDFVDYYNSFYNEDNNQPVTALCYDITKKKEDLWLAVIGCIADGYVPEFYKEFRKIYPDLSIDSKKAFDIVYGSQVGKISQIFSYALKDKTTNVVNMLRFLMKAETPYEVLEESSKNKSMHERFRQIEKKIDDLINKKEIKYSGKILFFKYGGDLSISSELSNILSYRFPDKIIIVAYVKGPKVNLSLRGENIKKPFLQVIEGIEGAKGGGHRDAVGAQIHVDNLEEFRRRLGEELGII